LLVLQGELVDDADEGGDVGAELGEFLVLGGDPLHQLGDGGAEARLVTVVDTAFLDSVEQAGPSSAMLPVEDAAARMKPRASRNGRLRNGCLPAPHSVVRRLKSRLTTWMNRRKL